MSDLMGLNIDELCPIGTYSCNLGRIHFLPHQEKRMSLDDMTPTIAAAKAASARKSAKTSIDGEKREMFARGPREPAAARRLDVALA
ncbi:hypothetical protein KDX04_18890 [Burkholderia cenocepacia]|uniref:hypothetical protein n=1 Tax=Burkholderia cenocepacia TaxID=95486 RepID=UPI001B9A55D4|nr:hypothetical protein [Burkholderia cenocepacia]MBR7987886.1 hypothetical protein [Burkholderia cenocepacia]